MKDLILKGRSPILGTHYTRVLYWRPVKGSRIGPTFEAPGLQVDAQTCLLRPANLKRTYLRKTPIWQTLNPKPYTLNPANYVH